MGRRDFYLTGVLEQRNPRHPSPGLRQGATRQLRALPGDQLLEALAVRVEAHRAPDLAFTPALGDSGETFAMELANGVLHYRPATGAADVTLPRAALIALVGGEQAEASGDRTGLDSLIAVLDRFDFWFNIV